MRLVGLCCVIVLSAGAVFGQDAAAKKPKVLLAYEKTRFKTALVEAMQKQLAATGCEVNVVRHSKKGLDAVAADYDAVFITNSGVNSKVRPWIMEWLASNKDQQGRVLLHTTQTRKWPVKVDVDAVTSASSKRDVEELATDYVGRLKGILEE